MKISLDGSWLFKNDPDKAGVTRQWYADSSGRGDWQAVDVPSFWERYSGMRAYDGWGWFARRFEVRKSTGPVSMHFGGVDDDATVWVNGVEVGSHPGYSEPFAFDVTATLREGVNTIVILVQDHGGGGGVYKSVTLVSNDELESLFRSEFYGRPSVRSTDWVKDAVIYSVYLRSFSPEGTFAGLENRVQELHDMGVTVLWLMPIHPVGEKNRKGRLGSPYSVKDYYGINPEFGTMADFKRLLRSVHKANMKLIIDLVANHTAWDSKLIREHPEWFTKDKAGNIVAPNADWTDVADLDYSQPGLRKYMIEMMRWWVKDVGIDGFRCDVSELVPTDFWDAAREQLSRIKPVMMLSEGTIPEHHLKAFDLTYSWSVYDILPLLLQGSRPVTALDDILRMEHLQFPTGSLRLRFNTNHDKNAWDAPAILRYGNDGLKLTAVLVNTMPGVPLIYTGEEVANQKKLSLFDKVSVDWKRPRMMGKLYSTLFHLRREHMALSRGDMVRISSKYPNDVYAFLRMAGKDKILTVLNFSSAPRADTLVVPMDRVFAGQAKVVLTEVFSGRRVEVATERGGKLDLELGPQGYRVFVMHTR